MENDINPATSNKNIQILNSSFRLICKGREKIPANTNPMNGRNPTSRIMI